ncbi:mCG1035928 [Mus musculus]|nr:mCG1035928 [Mus musculus]
MYPARCFQKYGAKCRALEMPRSTHGFYGLGSEHCSIHHMLYHRKENAAEQRMLRGLQYSLSSAFVLPILR